MTKKQLMARFQTACRRIKKEERKAKNTADRLRYWRHVRDDLQSRYQLAKQGQLEFPGIDDQVSH